MAVYYPPGYFPNRYWANGYFPDDTTPGVPTGIGVGTMPMLVGQGVSVVEADEGGGWWQILPRDLRVAFGLELPDPVVVPVPPTVGDVYVQFPMVRGKGLGTTDILPEQQAPSALPVPATMWARGQAPMWAIQGHAKAKAYPIHYGMAKCSLWPIQGRALGLIGALAGAQVQLGVFHGDAKGHYTVATDEEFLELVGNVLLKMDILDVSQQEMEDLLAMAQLAETYFDESEVA